MRSRKATWTQGFMRFSSILLKLQEILEYFSLCKEEHKKRKVGAGSGTREEMVVVFIFYFFSPFDVSFSIFPFIIIVYHYWKYSQILGTMKIPRFSNREKTKFPMRSIFTL